MSIIPSPSTSATEVDRVSLLPPGRATSVKVLPPALPKRIWLMIWMSASSLPTTMSMNPSPSTSATAVEVVNLLRPRRVTTEKVLPPVPNRIWFSWSVKA